MRILFLSYIHMPLSSEATPCLSFSYPHPQWVSFCPTVMPFPMLLSPALSLYKHRSLSSSWLLVPLPPVLLLLTDTRHSHIHSDGDLYFPLYSNLHFSCMSTGLRKMQAPHKKTTAIFPLPMLAQFQCFTHLLNVQSPSIFHQILP